MEQTTKPTKTGDHGDYYLKEEKVAEIPPLTDREKEIIHKQFEAALLELGRDFPFYGMFGINVTKFQDDNCPTAYVTFEDIMTPVMGYNPMWMKEYSHDEIIGIIQHEYLHLILGHLSQRATKDPKDAKLGNIAQDLALNCLIPEGYRPHGLLYPGEDMADIPQERVREFFKNLPKNETSEWYFKTVKAFLKKEYPDCDSNTALSNLGFNTMDDHTAWENLPEETQELIKQKIDQMTEEGYQAALEKNKWSNMPSSLKEKITKRMNEKRKVDWLSVLRFFVAICRASTRVSTIKRLNKKAPYLLPGCKRGKKQRFLVAVDQSGSMSSTDIQLIFKLLFDLCGLSEIDVVNFDTELDMNSFRTWKKNENVPWKRTRCGGTDFECVRKFVNDSKNRGRWSGLIIATDGYANKLGTVTGVGKVLWLLTGLSNPSIVRKGDLVLKMPNDRKEWNVG